MLSKPPSAAPTPKDSNGVVDIVSNPKRRSEVDTSRLNPSKIIIHGEGYAWTLKNYYHSQVGMDNVLDTVDLLTSNATQQYHRIQSMVVRLSSPLAPNQNVEEKNFNINSEFFIDAGIKPNRGDVFTARLVGGVEVIFTVTETEMLSISKNASYRVEFVALTKLTEEYEKSLNSKVTKVFRWAPEKLERTGEVLVTEKEYVEYADLRSIIKTLEKEYMVRYRDNRTRSLTIPLQSQVTHDPHITNFVKWLGLTDLEEFNHPPYEMWRVTNLLTFLRKPRPELLKHVNRKQGLVTSKLFNRLRTTSNIGFSGYMQTVWSDEYVSDTNAFKVYPTGNFLVAGDRYDEGVENPIFKAVTLNPYIFTEGFYNSEPESLLEELVLKYIKNEAINYEDVMIIYRHLYNLPELEFFYYTPLVLLVMRYVGI